MYLVIISDAPSPCRDLKRAYLQKEYSGEEPCRDLKRVYTLYRHPVEILKEFISKRNTRERSMFSRFEARVCVIFGSATLFSQDLTESFRNRLQRLCPRSSEIVCSVNHYQF